VYFAVKNPHSAIQSAAHSPTEVYALQKPLRPSRPLREIFFRSALLSGIFRKRLKDFYNLIHAGIVRRYLRVFDVGLDRQQEQRKLIFYFNEESRKTGNFNHGWTRILRSSREVRKGCEAQTESPEQGER
jgi:hypothetical protein